MSRVDKFYKKTEFLYYTAMNFRLFEATAQDWDNWLLEQQNEDFLQSYAWGEFQDQEGRPVIRIQGEDQGDQRYQVQGFVHSLPFGLKYVYFPHILAIFQKQTKDFLQFLKKQGFVFARFEPREDLEVIDFKKIPTHHRQYQYTSILDLQKSDEELLTSFHEKTRYNIRLASKKGVRVVQEKNSEVFWPLIKETYERDKIKSHSEKYYADFIALPGCAQLTAYFDDLPLASVLLYTFGKTSVYVHGASSNHHRNLMAPYLLQWEAMKYARSIGAVHYDLGGVAQTLAPDHPQAETFFTYSWNKNDKLSGVTRFKAGFNGTIKYSSIAFDVIFDGLKYNLYRLAKKFL